MNTPGISREFSTGELLRFAAPSIVMMLFLSMYTIVDGFFISRYVGTAALSATNIVYPLIGFFLAVGIMFATGGSAVAALLIGSRREEEANRAFSVSLICSLLLGCGISLLFGLNLSPVLDWLGATPATMADCQTYAIWWLMGAPLVIGKELFTYFIRVDGAPTYSFLTALAGGICNIVLDYLLVARLNMGIQGAAAATILGLLLSFCMGIFYFAARKKIFRFTTRGLTASLASRCMVNGVSECVNQLAIAITTVVFNRTAMVFAGEDGIAAVSIIMYLQFLVIGIYFGFSMGIRTAPWLRLR